MRTPGAIRSRHLRPAHQRERRPCPVAGRRSVARREPGAGRRDQRVQPQHVDVVVGQAEAVSARGAHHDLRRRRGPGPRHHHLQRLRRVRRPVIAPQLGGQPLVTRTVRRLPDQHREQRLRPLPRDGCTAPPDTVEQGEGGAHAASVSGRYREIRPLSLRDYPSVTNGLEAISVPSSSVPISKSANTLGTSRCSWRRHSIASARISTSACSVARMPMKWRHAR